MTYLIDQLQVKMQCGKKRTAANNIGMYGKGTIVVNRPVSPCTK